VDDSEGGDSEVGDSEVSNSKIGDSEGHDIIRVFITPSYSLIYVAEV